MLVEFFAILAVSSLFLLTGCQDVSRYLESPCPIVFQYQFDPNGMLSGSVKIPTPNTNKVQLNIELSIGNDVEGYNGNVQLLHSKEQVIDDVTNGRPVLYKVLFPAWSGIPPKVTKILVNGELICSGPKIAINLVPVVTTINLQHTLSIDVLPLTSGSNPPAESNFIPPPQEFPPGDDRFDGNPPRRPPPFDDPNNQFDFNPPPRPRPSGQNNINFNPQMPKDPSKIYAGNPFLNILTSTSSPDKEDNPPKNPFVNTRTTTDTPTERVTSKPAQNEVQVVSKGSQPSDRPYDNVCGRSVTTNSLIVNGDEVPRGAYPWLVAIFGVKNTGLNYMCSGSLISDRHVVTAAHCVKTETKKLRPQELLIILGKLNVQKWVPSNGEKMIEPESIHVHPDYESLTSDADIAVLTLSESVQFTKYIRPLCLWNSGTDLNAIVGKQGTVVGWGKDENGDLMTAEPKQIKLPVVSQETCLRSAYQFQYITSNRTFCAGFRNGSGPCNGDSGSGFLMQRDGRWVLRGIVSMSISDSHSRTCDLKNYVVFTDASKYMDWLLSFIK